MGDAAYLRAHKHLWELPISRTLFAAIKARAPDPLGAIVRDLVVIWCGAEDGPKSAGIKEAVQLLHAAATGATRPMTGRELLLAAAGLPLPFGDAEADDPARLKEVIARLTAEKEAAVADAENNALARAARTSMDAPPAEHSAPPLPPGLAEFEPLQKVERVAAFKEPLKALEKAFAAEPTGAAANALSTKTAELRTTLEGLIAERCEEAGLIGSCDKAVTAGAELFTGVYDSVNAMIGSTEAAGVAELRRELSAERLTARVGRDGAKAQQRTADLLKLYADAVGARSLSNGLIKELAKAHGVKLPEKPTPLKATIRILEKALLRPDAPGKVDKICDVVRDMLTCEGMAGIAALVRAFLDDERIVVVRVKDRFDTPSGGGWRDVMINYYHVADGAKHVCEVQIVHSSLLTARKGLPGHAIYNVVRNANELLECVGLEKEGRPKGVAVCSRVEWLVEVLGEDQEPVVRLAATRRLEEVAPEALAERGVSVKMLGDGLVDAVRAKKSDAEVLRYVIKEVVEQEGLIKRAAQAGASGEVVSAMLAAAEVTEIGLVRVAEMECTRTRAWARGGPPVRASDAGRPHRL